MIHNQNGKTLGGSMSECPLCAHAEFDCNNCLVTKTFKHRWCFRNMKREKTPCKVLMRRIIKSRNPRGLLFNYLKQIESKIDEESK